MKSGVVSAEGQSAFLSTGFFLFVVIKGGLPARCVTVAILPSDQNNRQRRVDSPVTEEEGALRPLLLRILESDHAEGHTMSA